MQETRVLTLTDSHVNDSVRDKSVEAARHWAGSQGGELPHLSLAQDTLGGVYGKKGKS